MIKVFFDSSVIVAALISKEGASRKILTFCEAGFLEGWVSEPLVTEVSGVIRRKFLQMEGEFQEILHISKLKVVKKIKPSALLKARGWIADPDDVHVLAAAKQADVDVLLTLDLRHFIKDVAVAKKSGMKILTPGEFMKGFIKFA